MSAASPSPSPPRRRLPAPRVIAVAALAVILVGWEGWRLYKERAEAGRLFGSGSIEATEIDVTPRVAGRVVKLAVKEGDPVKAGQILAELEPQEATAQVAQAQAAVVQAADRVVQAQQAVAAQQQVTFAQVAQAQAQVTSSATRVPQSEMALAMQERTLQEAVSAAQAQFNTAQAHVASSRSALVKARDDLGRAKALFAQGAVAADRVDSAQAAYDAAVAQDHSAEDAVSQARANLASARANLRQVEVQRKAVEAARATVAQAQAGLENAQSGYTVIAERQQDLAAAQSALAQAQANLRFHRVVAGHDTIVSPRDGTVRTKNVQVGEVVASGAALYTLTNPQDTWIRIYIREDRIGRVKIGQPVSVRVATIPGRVFRGRVTEINTKPEFTTVNVQTKEDRVKLVFGVKIQLDNQDRSLEPGMPADVEILVRDQALSGRVGAPRRIAA
jgi:multidrug resistance efflux pump